MSVVEWVLAAVTAQVSAAATEAAGRQGSATASGLRVRRPQKARNSAIPPVRSRPRAARRQEPRARDRRRDPAPTGRGVPRSGAAAQAPEQPSLGRFRRDGEAVLAEY